MTAGSNYPAISEPSGILPETIGNRGSAWVLKIWHIDGKSFAFYGDNVDDVMRKGADAVPNQNNIDKIEIKNLNAGYPS